MIGKKIVAGIAGIIVLCASFVALESGLKSDVLRADVASEVSQTGDTVQPLAYSFSLSDFEYELSDSTCILKKYKGDTKVHLKIPCKVTVSGKQYSVQIAAGSSKTADLCFYHSAINAVSFEEGFTFQKNCANMFYDSKIGYLSLDGVNFSNVEDMHGMFMKCSFAGSLDLGLLDTRNVRDMSYAFSEAQGFKNFNKLNTGNVETAYRLFYRGYPGKDFSIAGMDFSNCTSMTEMFRDCQFLETVDFTNVKMGKVTSMKDMFNHCLRLKDVNFAGATTGSRINVGSMFAYCEAMTKMDMTQLSFTAVGSDLQYMFFSCDSLKQLDLSTLTLAPESDKLGEYVTNYFLSRIGDELEVVRTPKSTVDLNLCPAMRTADKKFYSVVPASSASITLYTVEFVPFQNVEAPFNTNAIVTAKLDVDKATGYSYEWEYWNASDSTWVPSTDLGANSVTIAIKVDSNSDGRYYRCKATFTDALGAKAQYPIISNEFQLHGYTPSVTIVTQPKSVGAHIGTTATFSVEATGNHLTYLWSYSVDGKSNWKYLEDCTGPSITVPATMDRNGYYYRCSVNSASTVRTSSAAKLTVFPMKITKQPVSVSGYYGDKVKFSISTESGVSFQWQVSSNGGSTWSNSGAPGNKTSEITVTAGKSNDGVKYRCVLTNSYGSRISSTATLTSKEIVLKQSGDVKCWDGDTATFTVTAHGSNLSYQWQYSRNNGQTWTNCAADCAKTKAYSVTAKAKNSGTQYRCIVKNGTASETTEAVTMTVIELSFVSHPVSKSSHYGDKIKFSVSVKAESPAYQWQYSDDNGSTWKNSTASGYKTTTLTVVSSKAVNGRKYRCQVTCNGKSKYSNAATLTASPIISRGPVSGTAAVGEKVVFTVTAEGQALTYQWQASADGGKTWKNSSATGNNTSKLTVTVRASYAGYRYRCIVTNNSTSATSSAARLIIAQ